jgi:radical SAM superfamily enzyme YgiQ (UPF0313 family)
LELAKRPRGDEYTPDGAYPLLRQRLRAATAGLSIPTAVFYAFDKRTRLLPYFFSSHHMAPAGARAVGSALYDSGLTHTRIVLQQWSPHVQPSRARLDGSPLEMVLVSSMQIHAENAYALIRDACTGRSADRPLIIAGGPKAIYEPWDLFGIHGDPQMAADVVVTGEEFVLMQLLEVLLGFRGAAGTMLAAFRRARRAGALADIPGLVYRQDDALDAPLVTTGIQRLVRDLDELPHPVIGYGLLEPPHRGRELRAQPIPLDRVGRYSRIGSLVLSHGCKFNCDYCPIPAYNQRTYRHKSGDRIVDELRGLREQLGIRFYFGTDDNFFNHRESVQEMLETMARATIAGRPIRKALRWGTESTAFDAWKNRDLLRAARGAGMRALWLGIEDITATLIRKGQSVNQTAELFALLNRTGICPMPMMMHHDGQPLYTRNGPYGLLNQVRFLRQHGAPSVQVTVLTPAVGTRSYEPVFEDGTVFQSIGGRPVLQYQFDGNHVVASKSRRPWRVQLNVVLAYAWYYNPINLIRSIVRPSNRLFLASVAYQLSGMLALCKTAVHSAWWAYRLWRGPIVRRTAPPGPRQPLIDVSPRREPAVDAPAAPGPRPPTLVRVGLGGLTRQPAQP